MVKKDSNLNFNTKPDVNLDERAINILKSMQNIVRDNNLDLVKIFKNFDK